MSSVRIEDVALKAGVSMKTVSRVLNNEPNVRDATRKKVMAAVETLNYRPNPSARSLAGSRSYLVGLLYGRVSPAYLFEVQSGALEACNAAHYGLALHPCEVSDDELAEDVATFVRQSHVDGLVLTPPISDKAPLIAKLDQMGVPYVRISPMDSDVGATVNIDEKQAAHDMMAHLLGLGHKRIGFIRGPKDHGASHWRYESYKEALQSAVVPFDESLVAEGDFTFDSGLAAGRTLLELSHSPSAIFASNDNMAAGVLHAAFEAGLRVPDDLSVVGFDDAPLARQIWPSLTTIHQPMRSMGRAAARQLLAMMDGETIKHPQMLDYELKLRASTAKSP